MCTPKRVRYRYVQCIVYFVFVFCYHWILHPIEMKVIVNDIKYLNGMFYFYKRSIM